MRNRTGFGKLENSWFEIEQVFISYYFLQNWLSHDKRYKIKVRNFFYSETTYKSHLFAFRFDKWRRLVNTIESSYRQNGVSISRILSHSFTVLHEFTYFGNIEV